MAEMLGGAIGSGFGGDALNAAVYLAREAPTLHVALASAIGDDPPSRELRALCRAEQVDLTHVRTVAGARLGSYRVHVDDAGERSFTYERSESPFRDVLADGGLLPDPREVDLLVFSGISIAVSRGGGRDVLLRFAENVQATGAFVAYDVNHRASLWGEPGEARAWLHRIAPIAGVVFASVDDGRALLGASRAVDLAAALRSLGCPEAVVTDGSRPCAVATEVRIDQVRAAIPTAVVDSTAAGDAFDAGYLAARLRGEDPASAAVAGHRAAARVVAHPGAIVPRS